MCYMYDSAMRIAREDKYEKHSIYHPRNETCFQMLDFIRASHCLELKPAFKCWILFMHPTASNWNMLSNVGSYSCAVHLQQCKYDTTVRIRVQAQGSRGACGLTDDGRLDDDAGRRV